MPHKRSTRSFALTLTTIVVALGACGDLHRGKVPGDAKPSGFKQLVSWNSCGASGQYCSQEIILGGSDISFDDATRDVEARYRKKSWDVYTFPESREDDGGLIMRNPDSTTCIFLAHFNMGKYRRYLEAPDTMTMAKLVEPYSIVIHASAGICG